MKNKNNNNNNNNNTVPGGEIRDTWIVRETVIILTVIAG